MLMKTLDLQTKLLRTIGAAVSFESTTHKRSHNHALKFHRFFATIRAEYEKEKVG